MAAPTQLSPHFSDAASLGKSFVQAVTGSDSKLADLTAAEIDMVVFQSIHVVIRANQALQIDRFLIQRWLDLCKFSYWSFHFIQGRHVWMLT